MINTAALSLPQRVGLCECGCGNFVFVANLFVANLRPREFNHVIRFHVIPRQNVNAGHCLNGDENAAPESTHGNHAGELPV
jgi:hypothetical protein